MITGRSYADQVRWDADTLRDNLAEHYGPATPRVLDKIAKWLERGDGVAVYEDVERASPGRGDWKVTSYGSPAAQLETDQPPMRLPDGVGGRGSINWRFVLVGMYRATEEEERERGKPEDPDVRAQGRRRNRSGPPVRAMDRPRPGERGPAQDAGRDRDERRQR